VWRAGRCVELRKAIEPMRATRDAQERQLKLLVDERKKQTDEVGAINALIAEINERCAGTRGENDALRAEV
jgi:uncharacterized coiled-coil DUF342 family protein